MSKPKPHEHKPQHAAHRPLANTRGHAHQHIPDELPSEVRMTETIMETKEQAERRQWVESKMEMVLVALEVAVDSSEMTVIERAKFADRLKAVAMTFRNAPRLSPSQKTAGLDLRQRRSA